MRSDFAANVTSAIRSMEQTVMRAIDRENGAALGWDPSPAEVPPLAELMRRVELPGDRA